MARREMNCGACETRFPAQAFCPGCGAPTDEATTEQRMLWEMGQADAAPQKPQSIKLSIAQNEAPAELEEVDEPARVDAAPSPPPRPFSPVPMPRRATQAPPRTQPSNGAAAHPPASPGPAEPVRRSILKKPGRPSAASAPRTQPSPKTEPEPAAETAPAAEAAPVVPAGGTAARARKAKPTRKQRKLEKLLNRLGMRPGETLTAKLDGSLGVRTASLLLTNYRVAVVPHKASGTARWIPLEEVGKITGGRGNSHVAIDATVEVLRFGARRVGKLGELVELLRAEVKEARQGRRHSGELIQVWCDMTADIWDSTGGRFRLWVLRHPKVKLVVLVPFAPLVYVLGRLL